MFDVIIHAILMAGQLFLYTKRGLTNELSLCNSLSQRPDGPGSEPKVKFNYMYSM